MFIKYKLSKILNFLFHQFERWNFFLNKGKLLIVSLCILSIASCIKDDFSIGKEYLQGNMRIMYIDTCTAIIKTVRVDSFVTSGQGVVLAGRYHDNFFGTTTATSYLPFKLPTVTIQDDYEFDSILFYVKYGADFYGDTTKIQNYKVYRLTEALNNKDYHYNTSHFGMEAAPLATISWKPKHSERKLMSVRLPKALGEDLLDKFMKDDLDVQDDERFSNYFKGLALVPDDNDSSLVSSFTAAKDSSVFIKIFYHYYNTEKRSTEIQIILDKTHHFNQLKYNREKSKIKNFNKNNELPADFNTDYNAFIQGLSGLSVEVEMPYLKDLNLLGENVGILGVNMVLTPVKGTYNKQTPLPDSLSLFILNQVNTRLKWKTMKIFRDELNYDQNTVYDINISDFFKDQLQAFGIDKKKIKITTANNINYFLKRIVVGNSKKLKNQPKVELKLIVYAEKDK